MISHVLITAGTVWSSVPTNNFAVGPPLKDHYAIVTGFECNVTRPLIKHKFRPFSADNVANFRSNMEAEFASYRAISHDVNEEAEHVLHVVQRILYKYFPLKTRQLSNRRLESPWTTSAIVKCINKKHRWFRMANNNLITKDSYKNCCISLRNLLRLAKEEYYRGKFTSLR